MIFKKFFIAELQEINKIIETVKYADKLGMSSFDVGLSLLLDAAEIIIVICIVIGLFKKKKIKFTGRNTVIVVSLWLVSHLLCVVFNSSLPGGNFRLCCGYLHRIGYFLLPVWFNLPKVKQIVNFKSSVGLKNGGALIIF